MRQGALRRLVVLCVAASTLGGVAPAAQKPVNPQAAALKDFNDRVLAYVAVRDEAARTVPAIGDEAPAEALAPRREALATAIRKARSGAQEGDVFTPAVAAQFRAIIRADFKARDYRDAVAALEEVPVRSTWVNMAWPLDSPRPTLPGRILTSLHPLPAGLEYRLLNRHLVLLDTDAEIVVDVVRDVVPSSIRPRVKQ